MNSLRDTAHLALEPLINLAGSPQANMNATAVTHWLRCDHFGGWGASMYLHGPTRYIYARGGLSIEPSHAEKVQTSNGTWNRLFAIYDEGTLGTEDRLYLIRLLLYMGLYEDAQRHVADCGRLDRSKPYGLWLSYLDSIAEQMHSPLIWDSTKLEHAFHVSPHDDDVLTFHITLQLAAHYIRTSTKAHIADHYFQQAEDCVANFSQNGRVHNLALARLERHKAAYYLKRGDIISHQEYLRSALSRLDTDLLDVGNVNTPTDFLARETARRLCAYGTHTAMQRHDLNEALAFALKAFYLDSTCSAAALQLGEIAFHLGQTAVARTFFDRAARTGILERPFALLRSTQCRLGEFCTEYDVLELISEDYFESLVMATAAKDLLTSVHKFAITATITQAWLEQRTSELPYSDPQMPTTVADVEHLLGGMPTPADQARWIVERSEVYHRFSPFWTLRNPGPMREAPYWAKQPVNAWRVWVEKPIPWFRSIYYQSTQSSDLRDRLLWGAMGHQRLVHSGEVFGETLDSLRGVSDEMSILIALHEYDDPHTCPLDRTYLARVLGYLGFADEALALVPIPYSKIHWTEEDAYLSYTNLFFRYVSHRADRYLEDCDRVFSRIPDSDSCLRTKLVLCIQCGGYCGKQKDIRGATAWRQRGLLVLDAIEKSSSFSTVERKLLTSRFWRFASFIPFLIGDQPALVAETLLYEELARACRNEDEYAKENMYAALETRARIREYLGDISGAIASFEELVRDVDPFDSKAWLNLGDLREKRGDLHDAVRDYMKAARLGPPGREIAWFRAGTCLEALGEAEEAIRCHLRSLSSYPLGSTPLLHTARLSKMTGNSYLLAWTQNALEHICVGNPLDGALAREFSVFFDESEKKNGIG